MRVGIFGGTFNPPHIGHMICAAEAIWQLELDHVLLMPVGEAPHKTIDPEPGREARYELCRLAAADDTDIEVSRAELDREGPSYTVDTLAAMCSEHPERELVFIMGGDQAASLPRWREPERILELATVAVTERDEARRGQIAAAVRSLAGAERIRFFDMPLIDLSSTDVRERVVGGRPFHHLVPERVAQRIVRVGLYGQEKGL